MAILLSWDWICRELGWFRRRLVSAWNILSDRSFDDGYAEKEVWCSPGSWRCTRCGKGFGGSLVVPPNDRPWNMHHTCLPKSAGVGTRVQTFLPDGTHFSRRRKV